MNKSKAVPIPAEMLKCFLGRRKNDPDDPIDHKDRRELRALRVFSSWVNNYDIRESNTLDMLVEESGRRVLKHYLIDFNTSLGSGTEEGKPPMTTHEYLMDYGEATKAFFTLGWWEKPWQKRWRESGEKITNSPAVGYFDNRYFDPGKFKVQLPHFIFKDLTRADGFWAAKIVMSFTKEDIEAMVKPGELTSSKDAETLVNTLVERRDIIGRYWFQKASPLDEFEVSGNQLKFKDLAVEHDFVSKESRVYHVDVIGKKGNRGEKVTSVETREPSVDLQNWLSQNEGVDLLIRTTPPPGSSAKSSPTVLVELNSKGVAGVTHED